MRGMRPFTTHTRTSFACADEPEAFFTHSERIFLLAPILTDDQTIKGEMTGTKYTKEANGTVRVEKTGKIIRDLFPLHNLGRVHDVFGTTSSIRAYFGEEIGFYFGFVSVYMVWLIVPAILGTALFVYQMDHGYDNLPTALYSLFLAIWATSFLEYWKRTQSKLAYEWDVLDFEHDHEEDTPAYMTASSENSMKSREYMYVLPTYKRAIGYAISFFSISAIVTTAVATMLYFLSLSDEALATWKGGAWDEGMDLRKACSPRRILSTHQRVWIRQ